MENFEKIINFFLSLSFWSVTKLVALVAILIYIVFTFIVIRQVSAMTEFITSPINFYLKLMAFLLFGVSVLVFVSCLLFI